MATQALSVQIPIPRWPLPLPLPLVPSMEEPSSPQDVDMLIFGLSKPPRRLLEEPLRSPPSPMSADSKASTTKEVLPVAFFPPRRDPVYIPKRDDFLRHPYFLKLTNEQAYTHPVFASDINSRMYRGFLRTQIADRPFFDPRGPPEWTAEYGAIYEICGRIYVQKFTEDGQSMLYRTRIRDKGEMAELRVLTESIIGRPSVYVCRSVRIFEEAIPYVETGFSPLPPFRPICERPTRMPHQPDCSCPRSWNGMPFFVRHSA